MFVAAERSLYSITIQLNSTAQTTYAEGRDSA